MQREPGRRRSRRRPARVLSWLLVAVIAVGVRAVGAVAVGSALGKWRLAPVLSGSMSPEIHRGDIVVAQPVSPRDLQPGDVLLFNAPIPGRPAVVHRIYDRQTLLDGSATFHT